MCVKKVKVGAVQDSKWIEGFTTKKNVFERTSYLLPLASETSFTELPGKTFASTNCPRFALLRHFSLH
jgi:hypothetical protein